MVHDIFLTNEEKKMYFIILDNVLISLARFKHVFEAGYLVLFINWIIITMIIIITTTTILHNDMLNI